jgi:serine/threonine-protein phosphatase 2A regulatory subunit B
MAGEDAVGADLSAKMLHLSWHPHANVIAAAALNSLYLFYARDNYRGGD